MAEEVRKFGHLFLVVAYLQSYPRALKTKNQTTL
jgi:hypothetical protein